ncbi:MAG: hypothetical protein GY705_32095 [Bacteroidetes bacterium]|nr:hypothetical protein [Bacteroidota bacterium]
MNILREMVQVLTKYKTKQIEVLGNPTRKKSKVYEFYEGIADGTFTSDEEAAAHFFDGDVKNQSYKNLKTKLKNRLLNTVFFVDTTQSMFNDIVKARINCYKEWTAAKILMTKQAREAGINISLKVLKQAKKAGLTEIIIEIANVLRNYYGSRKYDKKKFEEYNYILKENLIIWEKELFAKECYIRLTQHYLQSKVANDDLIREVTQYSELLKEDFIQYPTMRILFYAGMVEVTKFMAVNDYEATIQVCNKIIAKLLAKPLVFEQGVAAFSLHVLVCHTQLRQFEEGQRIINQLFKYLEPGTFNWFKGHELYMYLLFHTSRFQEAYHNYHLVSKAKGFKFLPVYIQETWKIFKAYIHFLIEVNLVQPKSNDKDYSKFRLGKFLNEVPGFSRDKRGTNISILVIQILFIIAQKKYGQAIDRIEAIEKYTTRYLKKDDHFRSNCFIKMVLEIPKSDFHRAAVERKSAKYRKRLTEMPLEIANQAHSIEVIPYENLWEMTLDLLDMKRHQVRW